MFLGDYTQSILMRATTEQVNGVWQGACYPFREGLSTGILNVEFTPGGKLLCGGTNRGWPVRGIKPFALERLDWSGKMPFEINRITIEPDGFKITFTKPVDQVTGSSTDSYVISAFTHPYHAGYGGPEIEQHKPGVKAVALAEDGLSAKITLEKLDRGFVYELIWHVCVRATRKNCCIATRSTPSMRFPRGELAIDDDRGGGQPAT